uniref:T9SS type A sorting domain-containing protein n=1 Tax=Flavobacterium sp. TaxID=239 RepID=UPI00261B2A03
ANIFFDTNPAIVTNTFNTEFVAALGNSAFDSGSFMMVPNPASDFVQIYLQNNSESIKSILIHDVLGKTIKMIDELNSNQTQINTSELSQGVYMIEITTNDGLKQVKKLVIK